MEHSPSPVPNTQRLHPTNSNVGQPPSGVLAPIPSVTANFCESHSNQFQPEHCNGQWRVSKIIPVASSTYVPPSVINNYSLIEENNEETLYDEIERMLSSICNENPESWLLPITSVKQNSVTMTTEADLIFGLENDAILVKLKDQQNHLERRKAELNAIKAEHAQLQEMIKNATKFLYAVEEKPEIPKGFLETDKPAILSYIGKTLNVVRSLMPTTSVENQ